MIFILQTIHGFFFEELEELRLQERKRSMLLLQEEKLSRLKSKALWLEAGDKNTKYFHKFASHRKNTNTILEIKDEAGGTTKLFKEKVKATVDHFQKRFAAPPGCPISEIIEFLNMFPSLIMEEMQ